MLAQHNEERPTTSIPERCNDIEEHNRIISISVCYIDHHLSCDRFSAI